MAYSFQSVDKALDSLGFSYVDGVTVKVAPKYCLNCDLSQVDEILNKPPPNVLAFDSNYDVSYEKQVLEDLKSRKQRDIDQKETRKKRIAEYEQKKAEEIEKIKKEAEKKALEDERIRLEEIEREKKAEEQRLIEEEKKALEDEAARKKLEEEAEWKQFEEERCNRDSVSCDKEEEEFKTPPQEVTPTIDHVRPAPPTVTTFPPPSGQAHPSVTPQQLPPPPKQNSEILVKGTQSKDKVYSKINFSDFEATSDPFADLELKSINDLAELQTILTSVAPPVSQQQQHHPYNNTSQAPYPAAPQGAVNYRSMAPSQALASRLAGYPPHTNAGPHYTNGLNGQYPPYYPGQYQPVSSVSSVCSPHMANTPPVTSQPYSVYNVVSSEDEQVRSRSQERGQLRTVRLKDGSSNDAAVTNGDLKPSRSVGDMISELQKEVEELQNQKKKSPNSRPTSRGATGLENWTPWPQLDQDNLQSQHQANPQQQQQPQDESCLRGLKSDEVTLCRQLHEMGFPLARLAKGVSAVGANSQKLINFCLVIDRLVDEGFNVDACEEVTMLHNAEEDICRKHLRSFQQIAEIGFPNKDVHQALIASSFDHQKALDQLIR